MAASSENDSMIRSSSGGEEEDEYGWMELQSNVYSAGIASVIQQIDAKSKANSEGKKKGTVRILVAVAVIFLAIGLQVFLVVKVKSLVCAKSVHYIRERYSEYEEHMYSETDDQSRGKGEIILDNFDSLDDDFKAEVCQFPLTQPDFLFAMLFLWTLTIVCEVRRCIFWVRRFVFITETDSEGHVHVIHPKEGTESRDLSHYGLDEGTTGLKSLSIPMKAVISLLFAVQASTALFLLWVGCRWLTATPSFSDLILNGLALTFIVEIKDMLYEELLPKLFQEETEVIRVRRERVDRNWFGMDSLLAPIFWAALSALWVVLYMFYFQAVLPDYRWDVKGPCYKFLTEVLTAV